MSYRNDYPMSARLDDEAGELADAFDGGKERDDMIDAVGKLQRALRDQGWSPR